MEKHKSCKNLTLSVADNGVKVTYGEEMGRMSIMDSRSYSHKEFVFSDKDLGKAFELFKSKLKASRSDSKEDESEGEEY